MRFQSSTARLPLVAASAVVGLGLGLAIAAHAPVVGAATPPVTVVTNSVVLTTSQDIGGVLRFPFRALTATCPQGYTAISGGQRASEFTGVTSDFGGLMAGTSPGGDPPSSWSGDFVPTSFAGGATPVNPTYRATVYVVCLQLGGGTVVSATSDTPKRQDDDQRHAQRSNRSGPDDVHTEGNVTALDCSAAVPSVTIANRDGSVTVRLLPEAARACGSIQVGDYLTAEGAKQNEALFEADDVSVSRRR